MTKGIGTDGVLYDPMPMDKCPDCTSGPFGFDPCRDHWEDDFCEQEALL